MPEFVPLALACGHLIEGVAYFDSVPGEPTKVECPEGCGWQQFVVEPGDDDHPTIGVAS